MELASCIDSHGPTTSRNEPIVWRDGNRRDPLSMGPYFDQFVRFDVPNFDLSSNVAADDLRAVQNHGKTAYFLLVFH